jgi:hypothetical protein
MVSSLVVEFEATKIKIYEDSRGFSVQKHRTSLRIRYLVTMG